MSAVVYDEFIFFGKIPVSGSGTCCRSSASANAGSPWKQINRAAFHRIKKKKRMRVRVSIQSHLPHPHHFVAHTHFSMTLLRFSAKLRLCLPVEVWWEKSHWGREERSLVLWDTCIHTHTPHSRQGVDRSDIWSCLTGQEKKTKKEERKRKEGKRGEGRACQGSMAFAFSI